jgi:arginyl-tRNA synthetase
MLDLLTQPLADRLAAHLGVPAATIAKAFAAPAKGIAADLALPCFPFAKAKGVPPPALAAELAQVISDSGLGVSASAAGPFLNLVWTPAAVAAALLPKLAQDPTQALRSDVGGGKRACIDFSSPNIAKHLAFHHIRSTMIGNALAHLYGAAGWKVTRINFLGDWGTAFGRLISGWKREGLTLAQLQAASDQVTFLNELYVRASSAAKGNPALEEDARLWSKKLEDGDAEARHLWQIFKDASLAEFKRIYDLLGVDFDSWKGEAYYEDKMGPVLAELEAKGLTSIDQGATIVDLPKLAGKQFKKPALIKRADGGSLYATRDLAACDDRFNDFAFDRSLYVVDLGQSLHFQEWFAIARIMGRAYADRLRHVGFGVVLMWNDEPGEGLEPGWAKGRTRGGKVMLLREVLEEARDRAAAIVAEKNPDLPADEQAKIATAVGVGAVVFNDLKNSRTGDVKFKFEDALRFDGETGPYLQFAHARLYSIESKARTWLGVLEAPEEGYRRIQDLMSALNANAVRQFDSGKIDYKRIERSDEKSVLLSIARLRSQLERAVENDEPSIVAQALLTLAGEIASWLSAGNQDPEARILPPLLTTSNQDLVIARLALVHAARRVLGEGLRLIGLVAPERM